MSGTNNHQTSASSSGEIGSALGSGALGQAEAPGSKGRWTQLRGATCLQRKLDATMLKRVQSGRSLGAESDGDSEGASRPAGKPGARRASCIERKLTAMAKRRSSRYSSGAVGRQSGRSSDGGPGAVSAAEAPDSKGGWARCAALLKGVRATSATGQGQWSGEPRACGSDVASVSSSSWGSTAESDGCNTDERHTTVEGEPERRDAFGEPAHAPTDRAPSSDRAVPNISAAPPNVAAAGGRRSESRPGAQAAGWSSGSTTAGRVPDERPRAPEAAVRGSGAARTSQLLGTTTGRNAGATDRRGRGRRSSISDRHGAASVARPPPSAPPSPPSPLAGSEVGSPAWQLAQMMGDDGLADLPRHPQRKVATPAAPLNFWMAPSLALQTVQTAAGPRMRAMPPRIGVSDLIEGGSRRDSGAGYEAPEDDMYWPDALLGCSTAGNASRRAGAAGGVDGAGGAGLPGLVPRGTIPRSGKAAAQEEDMWPDELLCGTGRGRAGTSSQPVDHVQEAPKEEEAWPSFFSLLRGTLSRGDSCKSSGVAFASVAASATRPRDGSPSAAAWRVKFRQTRQAADREAAKYAADRHDEYLLMLRVCQGKVSPLDGVTLACCPKPLLQLATQCCTLDPEVTLACAMHVCNSCVQFMCAMHVHRMCTACAPHCVHDRHGPHSRRCSSSCRARRSSPSTRRTARQKCALNVAACCPGRPARAPLALGCSAHFGGSASAAQAPQRQHTALPPQLVPKVVHFAPLNIQLGALCAAAAASARRLARRRRADIARQGEAGRRARQSRACVHTQQQAL